MKEERYKTLDDLKKHPVFYNFLQICKIPHQTFHEKELSDYLVKWATNLGLEVKQDSKFNLLIRKPASMGNEGKKPIILQAHIDMVCEKKPDVIHDFKKDPIPVQLDGDILSTGNKTTLGADDGIGTAMAMAILEAKNLKHPPIDVIFTTSEEEDMSGALNVDKSWFHTNRLINLDNSFDNEMITGSAGGKGAELKVPLTYEDSNSTYVTYKIIVDNLTGGHSGEDIDKGRGNAIIILARCLDYLRTYFKFNIVDIEGGNFRLAIPREAHTTIAFSKEYLGIFKEKINIFISEIKNVFETSEKNIQIKFLEHKYEDKILSLKSTNNIIDGIILSPNGILQMISNLGVVESSCNLGEIYIKDNNLFMVTEIRAIYESNREFIYKQILLVGDIIGGEVRDFSPYPSWTYKVHSNLRTLANRIYLEMFNHNIKNLVLHAGLECGCFTTKVNDLDAISIGPNTKDLHSPYESLSFSSTQKIYNYLIKILETLD